MADRRAGDDDDPAPDRVFAYEVRMKTGNCAWHSFQPYNSTIPIQNISFSPTSTSYLRTKSSLPVVVHVKHREPGGNGADVIAFTDVHRLVVLTTISRPDGWIWKVRGMDGLLDVLDRGRFASRLIDRIHDDAVLAAFVDGLSFVLHRRLRTVGPIDEAAVRMHVHLYSPPGGREWFR